jgi:hypothetical protein
VEHTGAVDVGQAVGDRGDGEQRLADREGTVGQPVGEAAAVEQRHHDERPTVDRAHVVDGHEARVVERGHERDLALDPRVVGDGEDLDRRVPVEE